MSNEGAGFRGGCRKRGHGVRDGGGGYDRRDGGFSAINSYSHHHHDRHRTIVEDRYRCYVRGWMVGIGSFADLDVSIGRLGWMERYIRNGNV